jgi:DNA-binding CsgD family transcriptional regulator
VREANALFVTAYMTLRHEDFAAAETVGAAVGTWYAPLAQVLHGLLHVLEGRPDRAEALLARAGGEVRHGIPTLGFAVDVAEAHLFLHRGELDHARGLLDRPPAAAEAAQIPMLRSGHAGARGWLAWEEHRLGDAAVAFAESLTSCLAGGGYDIIDTAPLMLPLQADTLVRLDRRAEVQQAIDRCAAADTEPDRFTVAAVAAARFRLAPSNDTAAAAERAAAAAPWPWLHALLGCWRGELLGDAEAAASARNQFDTIEALRGVERADAALHRLGRRAVFRAGAGHQELSPRELEVAALVADGLTNSAIAARLFVSRATVSSHVTHILTKLGFTSRAQIAAWVVARRPA